MKSSGFLCKVLTWLIQLMYLFMVRSQLWRSRHWSCVEVTLWGHLFPDEGRTRPSSGPARQHSPTGTRRHPMRGQQDISSNTGTRRRDSRSILITSRLIYSPARKHVHRDVSNRGVMIFKLKKVITVAPYVWAPLQRIQSDQSNWPKQTIRPLLYEMTNNHKCKSNSFN